MKFQLLLLGAIAALTVGAVSLAGSVPTASISPDRSALASQPTSSLQAPAEAAVTAPASTPVVVAPDTTSIPAVAEPVTQPATAPAAGTISAACASAIQAVQATHGRHPLARPQIASVIADCIGTAPAAMVAPGKSKVPGGHPQG